jgi:hypothetical protein
MTLKLNFTAHLNIRLWMSYCVLQRERHFQKNIPKKHKFFSTQIYKLCDVICYIYNMNVYLENDRKNTIQMITATNVNSKKFDYESKRDGS